MSEQQDILHISYLRDVSEQAVQRLVDIYDRRYSQKPWDKDEIISYLSRKDTRVCLVENLPGDIVGFALCQPRDGTLYVDELHIRRDDMERRYSQAKYAHTPYQGNKTAAEFLVEHLLGDMKNQNCNKADFSAIRDKPIISEILSRHYTQDPRVQVEPDMDMKPEISAEPDIAIENLSLSTRVRRAREKLREMTGKEWDIIKKSPAQRDIKFSLPADAASLPIDTYFCTEGKMIKPYAAYNAMRREIEIDAEFPEKQVNKSGMADKVYLPANWADDILRNTSPPGCLEALFVPSDKKLGGDFGSDFQPFR